METYLEKDAEIIAQKIIDYLRQNHGSLHVNDIKLEIQKCLQSAFNAGAEAMREEAIKIVKSNLATSLRIEPEIRALSLPACGDEK